MKKALIVMTNVEKYSPSNRPTGLWLGELTHFYEHMDKAGIQVDFVSPLGGYIPLDPHAMSFLNDTDLHYYQDRDFVSKALANTKKPSQVKADDYDVIYYTGGHGVMWDFPENQELAEIASAIYQKGGIVSAVCHGVVGLLPIKDQEGQPLIAGKTVTGFANTEEDLNGTTDQVPYLTEDALKEKGAIYESSTAFTPFVRVDGRLITGQNPQSAGAVGQAVLDLLASQI
ncbi:type 1 glutamine amidotransferase domain-containing protein [Streptococcus saliviloxodontae]|uniref:Intracellular protease/amidase n=1 Tax=Streptococcus saliviloxodontae TaxID=1349416 RepID=A0ABS2PM58_9STRE|nr:type 1 glutamine amidotransferase domain-containing protein [Streptococcus saliviloxodontae]MBM7636085.1 putative intracellular protease/amidase [Streptococcus saliviloxodontae]